MDRAFRRDPLHWLDEFAASGAPVKRVGRRHVAIANAALAREILKNHDRIYDEHSDFFGVGANAFGPRSSQVDIGRGGRDLALKWFNATSIDQCVAAIPAQSEWPRGANLLLERLAAGALTGDYRAPAFNRLRGEILAARIFDRETGAGIVCRARRRFSFYRSFEAERERWEETPGGHRDILDMVFDLGRHASTAKLLEIYVAFNFALIGSLGFALAWATRLTLEHGAWNGRPRQIIAETLRLYPVAWFLNRTARRGHELGAIPIRPGDELMIFTYAIHRDPTKWREPARFDPDRWNRDHDRMAWLPFGAGEHTCAAVSLTFQILERVMTTLFAQRSPRIISLGAPSTIGAALAPPRFTLGLSPLG
ncbi:MAG: cytochrome P450 [Sphingomonas sp.]|jgi:hypothetical protein|uniref:cytochrome P450 n=1 Tax=Sphingomonas sp. TaxID=28214 RepID=UPI0035644612